MRLRELLDSDLLLRKNLQYLNYSFSQEGEDILLDELLGFKKDGFYIDIGCYHPYRFSNTMKFYKRGWHGINIDATPGVKELFDRYRSRDVNVNVAIADKTGEKLDYYLYEDGAYNTLNKDNVEELHKIGIDYQRIVPVETYTVQDLFEKYVSKDQDIDFLDIDVEGYDKVLLSAMDFDTYRPNYILVETHEKDSEVNKMLDEVGYKQLTFTRRTSIFERMD